MIDTSKGLQSSDFVAFEMADIILMVIVLDLTCLRNTARLLNLFKQFEGMSERVKLVVNRDGAVESEISLKKAEETLRMPISWQFRSPSSRFKTPGFAACRSASRFRVPRTPGHPGDRPRHSATLSQRSRETPEGALRGILLGEPRQSNPRSHAAHRRECSPVRRDDAERTTKP